MSRFGWRWFDLGKDGSLQSVNGIVWPPNEPLQAECEYGSQRGHSQYLVGPDGTREELDPAVSGRFVAGQTIAGGWKVAQESVPAFNCGCGYWAYWDPELASGLPHVSGYLARTKVFGVIEAWGDMVFHELGFRAEWVIPRAVLIQRGKLHAAYSDVVRYRKLEDMIFQWDTPQSEDEISSEGGE